MSTGQQTTPRIWRAGNGYAAEDPTEPGKIISSPSYFDLARRLGLEADQQAAAADKRAAREAEVQARKDEAAAELPALEAAHEQAAADRDAAWQQFVDDCLNGGPFVASFAAYRVAFRKADGRRQAVTEAKSFATRGHEPRVNAAQTPATLADALDTVVKQHEQTLRQVDR